MEIFVKIGRVCLGVTSVAGAVAIGYLTYRGALDVLSAPNAVLELEEAYQKGVDDGYAQGRDHGYDFGYDSGYVSGADGAMYMGEDETLKWRFNSGPKRPEEASSLVKELFGEEAAQSGKASFSLKNAFMDRAEGIEGEHDA